MRLLLVVLLASPWLIPDLYAQSGFGDLAWTEAATHVDGSPMTVRETLIYRSNVDPVGPYAFVDSVPGGTVGYNDTGLYNGVYYWVATHVSLEYGTESANSMWASKVVNDGPGNDAPLAGTPINLTVQ